MIILGIETSCDETAAQFVAKEKYFLVLLDNKLFTLIMEVSFLKLLQENMSISK